MTMLSSVVADAVATTYDFSGLATVVDVGGGHGILLAAILSRHPHLTGTVFDLPQAVTDDLPATASSDVASRWTVATGSFFDGVPTGEALVLKAVLHDWPDERCVEILTRCREALPEAGVVLLVETVLGRAGHEVTAAFSDLNMLVLPGGRERSEREYADLLAAAGLRPDPQGRHRHPRVDPRRPARDGPLDRAPAGCNPGGRARVLVSNPDLTDKDLIAMNTTNTRYVIAVATLAAGIAVAGAAVAQGGEPEAKDHQRSITTSAETPPDQQPDRRPDRAATRHQRGIVLEGTGTAGDLAVTVYVYENDVHGNSAQVVLGDPGDDRIGAVEQDAAFVVDGVLTATVEIDGRTATVTGTVAPSGAEATAVDPTRDTEQHAGPRDAHPAERRPGRELRRRQGAAAGLPRVRLRPRGPRLIPTRSFAPPTR